MDGTVITYVATVDGAIGDTYGETEVMELQAVLIDPADADRTHKTVVLDVAGIEFVRDEDVVPAAGSIVGSDKSSNLARTEMPPAALGLADLFVTDVILVLAGRKIFGIYPAIDKFLRLHHCNFFHRLILYLILQK